MTKHRSIDEYKTAIDKYIYPVPVANKLGLTRQAVYYRLNTNKDLYNYTMERINRVFRERMQFFKENGKYPEDLG